ncbi:hypothetical protein [Zavarzinella formosa]|uniref:hypothetical protein n=1 Tax=Zavarzinella formosa TaxID=360055 RepID=UPI0002F4E53A|nr:hypothetical protein [Zavarzinella formosa]
MDDKTKEQVADVVTAQAAGLAMGAAIGAVTNQTLQMNGTMPARTAAQVGQAIGNAAANGAGIQGSLLAGAAVLTAKASVITAGAAAAAPAVAAVAAVGAVGWGLYKAYEWLNQEPVVRINGLEFAEDHVKISVRYALRDCKGVLCRASMRFEHAESGKLLNEPLNTDGKDASLFAPVYDLTPDHERGFFNFVNFTIRHDLLKHTLGEGDFKIRCRASIANVPAWKHLGSAWELFTFKYSIPRSWQFWRGGREICRCKLCVKG